MKDNQNRDLSASKRYSALLAEMHQQGSVAAAKSFEGKKLAEWTKVEGVQVLQVEGSDFVGVPVSGRKDARRFSIINLNDRTDIVCQVSGKEVYAWLFRMGN